MTDYTVPKTKAIYYRIVRAPSGAWCIQLYDIKIEQMGLASHSRAPLCFESVAQADAKARALGLRPLKGE